MKTLRSYVIKIGILWLIASGLMLSLIKPAEASGSNYAFETWLYSVAKKDHAKALEHKLRSLKKSGASINQLLEQASRLVRQNNKAFNLPLSAKSASREVYQILLLEWNQYQSGNMMAAPPQLQIVKPLALQSHQKNSNGYATSAFHPKRKQVFGLNSFTIENDHHFLSHLLQPLTGGIAIGAP